MGRLVPNQFGFSANQGKSSHVPGMLPGANQAEGMVERVFGTGSDTPEIKMSPRKGRGLLGHTARARSVYWCLKDTTNTRKNHFRLSDHLKK